LGVILVVFLAAFCLMLGSASFAEVKIVTQNKSYDSPGRSGPTQHTGKMYISEKGVSLKNVSADKGSPDTTMVYRYNSADEYMMILHHDRNKYQKMTEEDIQQMAKRAQATSSKMEQAMKNAPPQVKKMYRKKMGKKAEPEPEKMELKKVDSNVKVGDWTCDKYEAYRGGKKAAELWVTEADQLSEEDYKMLSRMSAFTEKFQKVASSFGSGKKGPRVNKQEFFDKEVFPVKSVNYANGKKAKESILVKMEKGNTPDSAFEVPRGYTKMENPTFGPR